MLFCSRGLHRRLARYGRCSSRRRARERPSANHRIVPTSSFTTASDGIDVHGGPKSPPPTNGATEINGTTTVPVIGHVRRQHRRRSAGSFRAAAATSSASIVATTRRMGSRSKAASRNGVVGAVGRTRSNGIRGTRASATRRIRYASSPGPHCRRHHAQRDASGPQPRFPRGAARRLGSAERPAHSHDPAIRERDRPGRRSDGCSPCGNVIWGALNDFENEPFPWWYDVWAVDFNNIVSGVRGRAPRPAQQRTTGGPGGPVTPASIPSPTPQQGASQ